MIQVEDLPWHTSAEVVLRKDEDIVDAFSTHWMKYAAPLATWAVLLGLAILGLCFASALAETIRIAAGTTLIVSSLLLYIIHVWFFQRILSEGMVDMIITTKRIIYLEDSLWFKDDMLEINIRHIRAVEAKKRGLLQNIFRYGSLWFDTGGSDADGPVIPLIPHPQRKAKIITALIGDVTSTKD